jgi:hypothetical protein
VLAFPSFGDHPPNAKFWVDVFEVGIKLGWHGAGIFKCKVSEFLNFLSLHSSSFFLREENSSSSSNNPSLHPHIKN